MANIFEFQDCRDYLKTTISENGRGYQNAICVASRVQVSYFSKFLAGKADLSLEQAFRVTRALGLDSNETEVFLQLIELSRSQNDDYRRFCQQKISKLKPTHSSLRKQVSEIQAAPENVHLTYYSHWAFAAVHIATGLSKVTTKFLSERLKIPTTRLSAVLNRLEKMGFIETQKDGTYRRLQSMIHVADDTWALALHHKNWRQMATEAFEEGHPENLNYTTVFTCSKTDFQKIKREFLNSINTQRKFVKNSPDEELYSLCLDLFRV